MTGRTAVIAYGDEETVTEHRDTVQRLAAEAGLDIIGWYGDPEGARGADALDELPGLVAALGDCIRRGASLLVPFPVDAPGEQVWRAVAAVVHWRGLSLFLSGQRYRWDSATDEIDFALKRQLDAAHALDVAAAAAAGLPDLDQLVRQLVRPALAPVAGASSWALRAADQLESAAEGRGQLAPPRPDASAPWPLRERQAREYATWLAGQLPQRQVAQVLNALGVRTPTGGKWTQPLVSRLVRGHYRGGRAHAA